jgi:hypothetical protein
MDMGDAAAVFAIVDELLTEVDNADVKELSIVTLPVVVDISLAEFEVTTFSTIDTVR